MPEQNEQSSCSQSVMPTLTVKGAARAIDFYKAAFGAEERMRFEGPEGGIMHAEIVIGDWVIFLNDEMPGMGVFSPETLGGATGSIYLSVPDVDTVFQRAVEAGAKEMMAVEDTFWGDRMGSIIDPFGHHWAIATHKEDVPPEEMRKRADEFFARMACEQEKDVGASI